MSEIMKEEEADKDPEEGEPNSSVEEHEQFFVEEIEIDPDDVKFVKTTNGEELIATIVEESEHKLGAFIPCKVFHSIHENEEGNVYTETSLAQWFQNSDPQFIVPIFKFHIVSMANPTEDYKRFYIRIAKKIFEEASMADPGDEISPEEETRMQLLTEDVLESQKEKELSGNERSYYLDTFREINKFTH